MTLTPDPRDAIFDVSSIRENLGQRTGRSAITVILFALIKLVFTIGTTAVLARLVGPQEQGLFALAVPLILIATSLSEFGLAQAVVQRETVTHSLVTTLFWINTALGVILSAMVAGFSGAIATFYDKPEVAAICIALAPFVLFTVLTTHYIAILRRQMRIREIETTSLLATVLSSGIAIIAGLMGAGLWALAVQLVLNPALTVVFLMLKVRWLPSRPKLANLGEAKQALVFGGFLAAERLLGALAANVQIIILGRYFTEVQAGLFYRSQTFAEMPQRRIAAPLSGAFIPALSRLQSEPEVYREMYIRQVSRANLILVPIALFFITAPDLVVAILLGPDWTDSVPVLQWLGVVPMVAITLSSLAWAMVSCGRTRELFFYRIFSATLLTLTLIISAQYGFMPMIISAVLVPVIISIPIMITVVIHHTPLTWGSFRSALGSELVFIAVALIACFALRAVLDLQTLAEGSLTGLLIVSLAIARTMASPGLRADVAKAISRKASRKG